MHYIKTISLSIDYIKEAILEIPNLNILLLSIDSILIIYIMYYKLFTEE
jgi:hypothetical protein